MMLYRLARRPNSNPAPLCSSLSFAATMSPFFAGNQIAQRQEINRTDICGLSTDSLTSRGFSAFSAAGLVEDLKCSAGKFPTGRSFRSPSVSSPCRLLDHGLHSNKSTVGYNGRISLSNIHVDPDAEMRDMYGKNTLGMICFSTGFLPNHS